MARTIKTPRPIREPVPLVEPGSDLGAALRHLMQTFKQKVDAGLRARHLELSLVQGMVLRSLSHEPGISGAQLARRATVTAQSMNGLLRSMESSHLVIREKHLENRHTDCWYLTNIGLEELEQAGEVMDEVMARVRSSISRADATRLVELLHKCAQALHDGAEKKAGQSTKASTPSSMRAR